MHTALLCFLLLWFIDSIMYYTVYPIEYAHCFVVFCFVVVYWQCHILYSISHRICTLLFCVLFVVVYWQCHVLYSISHTICTLLSCVLFCSGLLAVSSTIQYIPYAHCFVVFCFVVVYWQCHVLYSISHTICTLLCCVLFCCGLLALSHTLQYIPYNMHTALLCCVLFYWQCHVLDSTSHRICTLLSCVLFCCGFLFLLWKLIFSKKNYHSW